MAAVVQQQRVAGVGALVLVLVLVLVLAGLGGVLTQETQRDANRAEAGHSALSSASDRGQTPVWLWSFVKEMGAGFTGKNRV